MQDATQYDARTRSAVAVSVLEKPSAWDMLHSVAMAVACLISHASIQTVPGLNDIALRVDSRNPLPAGASALAAALDDGFPRAVDLLDGVTGRVSPPHRPY